MGEREETYYFAGKRVSRIYRSMSSCARASLSFTLFKEELRYFSVDIYEFALSTKMKDT